MIGLIQVLGKFVACVPAGLLRLLCCVLGLVIGQVRPSRKRQALASLHCAFPEKPHAWCRQIYRENCRRLIEMGLLVLALPHLSRERIQSLIQLDSATVEKFRSTFEAGTSNKPVVLFIPHLTLTEFLTALPTVVPYPIRPTKVIFRPIQSPRLNHWLERTRSRFGIDLLSRKQGFNEAVKALQKGHCVGVLFDQKAGGSGSLMTFFDRVCSTTELPGILADKAHADAFTVAIRRTGFWRGTVVIEPIEGPCTSENLTLQANRWLENYLSLSDNETADWLWLHDRWGNFYKPKDRFRLQQKRSLLVPQNATLDRSAIPRKTKVWIILPSCKRLLATFQPLLTTLREQRPDFHLTVCAPNPAVWDFTRQHLAEQAVELPRSTLAQWISFNRARGQYPETILLVDPAPRAALGAWLTGCPQCFGLAATAKRPRFVTASIPTNAKPETLTPQAAARVWLDHIKSQSLDACKP